MKSPRILVVDDEANVRLMLHTTLETEGYTLHMVGDGMEALRLLDTTPIDVVLLDLRMAPIDGLAVLREIKALHLRPPPSVVVLSAHSSIGNVVKAIRMGANDFIEKPFLPEDVRRAVALALQESETAPLVKELASGKAVLAGYVAILDQTRRALREEDFELAESLLKQAEELGGPNAEYFNLLGIYYEMRRQWRTARKFYGKAIAANENYQPGQNNMRRSAEIHVSGKSEMQTDFGDSPGADGSAVDAVEPHH